MGEHLGRHSRPNASELWWRVWLGGLAVVLLAMLVRGLHLSHGAYTDELYHLLAARGWIAEGVPRIAEGLYPRAWIYTMLTAWTFQVFGESLQVARWLAVVWGSLLVLALFLWTRSVAGAFAAWCAVLLLCFSPEAIIVSRFARFYALHAFLFFLGAIGTYTLFERRPALLPSAILALGVTACFALAYHLQITTAIGVGGILLWIGLAWVLPRLVPLLPAGRLRWGLLLGAALALAMAVMLIVQSETGGALWERLRHAPPWVAQNRNVFWYYHGLLSEDYASLWPLMPLTALVALAARPRPTLFCLFVFTPTLLVHSISAMKDMRYIYYVMPFLFVVWGIALQEVRRGLSLFVTDAGERALATFGLRMGRRYMRLGLGGAVLIFAIGSNAAFFKSAGLLAGLEQVMPVPDAPRWEASRAHLEPWLQKADVLATGGGELQALYYLGRYDVLISKSRAAEINQHAEFDPDPRTGRPVISTPAALDLLISCYETGFIVIPRRFWRVDAQVSDEVADVIVERATLLDLPSGLRLMAFVWDRAVADRPERCSDVRGLITSAGAGQ